MTTIKRFLRWLGALVMVRLLRRRAPEPEHPGPEVGSSRPGEPMAPERVRAEQAQEKEESHERIRRRRAEPPPTEEREVAEHRGSEWVVIVALLGTTLGAAGFIVFYVAFPDTQLLGLTIGLALAGLAVAAAVAGKRLVPQEKVVEAYHYFGDEESQEDVAAIVEESDEGVSRRKLIAGAAGTAGLTLGAAALFPAASLGPNVGEKIYRTPWTRGRRVVSEVGEPILAEDVQEGTFVTGFPEGASRIELGSPVIVVRIPPEELKMPPERAAGAPEGLIAFSKICPHAGCAVSILREPLYPPVEPERALVCPCHYSTFDPARGGHLLFGPAGRDLPQLPIRINAAGELEAAGEYYDPPGPSYGGIRLTS